MRVFGDVLVIKLIGWSMDALRLVIVSSHPSQPQMGLIHVGNPNEESLQGVLPV